MLIAARNGFLAGKNSILPPGARWVEYLESTGTQYVDTGYKPNTNTQIECLIYGDFNDKRIFGARESFGGKQCEAILYDQSSSGFIFRFGRTTGSSQITYRPPNLSATMKVVLDKRGVMVDDVFTAFSGGIGSSFQTPVNLLLFAGNFNGTQGDFATAKMWYCKIRDNGVLVRSLAPIAIGTTGYMLDLVSGEYLPYGNKGTGDFVIGPDTDAPAS